MKVHKAIAAEFGVAVSSIHLTKPMFFSRMKLVIDSVDGGVINEPFCFAQLLIVSCNDEGLFWRQLLFNVELYMCSVAVRNI